MKNPEYGVGLIRIDLFRPLLIQDRRVGRTNKTVFSISHPSSRSAVVSSTPAYRPRFDPLNLGSNSGGGPRRGGDSTLCQREGEKKEYGRGVAATKFHVDPREIYIYAYQARVQHRAHAGEEDLNFKFYLIIFEFNFVTCPEGGSPGPGSNLCDTHVRTHARARAHRYEYSYAHRIGVYLVAERAVGGFFLLHPAEEDVRDSSVGLFATDLAKAAR